VDVLVVVVDVGDASDRRMQTPSSPQTAPSNASFPSAREAQSASDVHWTSASLLLRRMQPPRSHVARTVVRVAKRDEGRVDTARE